MQSSITEYMDIPSRKEAIAAESSDEISTIRLQRTELPKRDQDPSTTQSSRHPVCDFHQCRRR